MNDYGSLVVVSGFSGVGKGTVLHRLMEKYDGYAYSVSATTRAPREGEVNGVHYFFKTQEEFDAMIEADELLEYARYVGHSYGTPAAFVEEQRRQGRDVILEIEVQGALNVRRRAKDAVLIFVMPPDADTLAQRLRGRGTESEDVIRGRLEQAAREAESVSAYDYIVVNDDVEACADRLHALIRSQRLRTGSCLPFIGRVKDELQEMHFEE